MEDARRLLLNDDQLPEDIPQPKVMVESQAECEAIIRLLHRCGIIRIMPDGSIPRVRGRRLFKVPSVLGNRARPSVMAGCSSGSSWIAEQHTR